MAGFLDKEKINTSHNAGNRFDIVITCNIKESIFATDNAGIIIRAGHATIQNIVAVPALIIITTGAA